MEEEKQNSYLHKALVFQNACVPALGKGFDTLKICSIDTTGLKKMFSQSQIIVRYVGV